jgi:hypothetical protein
LCRQGKSTFDCLGWFMERTEDFGMKLAILDSTDNVVALAFSRVFVEPPADDAHPPRAATSTSEPSTAAAVPAIRVVFTDAVL